MSVNWLACGTCYTQKKRDTELGVIRPCNTTVWEAKLGGALKLDFL